MANFFEQFIETPSAKQESKPAKPAGGNFFEQFVEPSPAPGGAASRPVDAQTSMEAKLPLEQSTGPGLPNKPQTFDEKGKPTSALTPSGQPETPDIRNHPRTKAYETIGGKEYARWDDGSIWEVPRDATGNLSGDPKPIYDESISRALGGRGSKIGKRIAENQTWVESQTKKQQPADEPGGWGNKPLGWGELFKEYKKGVARGAVNMAGDVVKSPAMWDKAPPNNVVDVMQKLEDVSPDWGQEDFRDFKTFIDTKLKTSPMLRQDVWNAARAIREGRAKSVNDMPELQDSFTRSMRNPTEEDAYKAGKEIQDWVAKKYEADPRFRETWHNKFAEGSGSLATFFAGSLIPFVGPAVSAGIGSAAASGGAIDEFKRKDDKLTNLNKWRDVRDRPTFSPKPFEELDQAYRLKALVGLTEAIPVEMALGRITRPFQKPVMAAVEKMLAKMPAKLQKLAKGKVVAATGSAAMQAVAEGGQEAGSQILYNLIDKFTFDPDKDTWEGFWESLIVGAGLGAGAQVAVDTVKGGQNAADELLRYGYEPKRPRKAQPGQTSNTDAKGDRQSAPNTDGGAEQDNRSPDIKDLQSQALLREANYTTEQIRDMNAEEFTQNVQEAIDAGVEIPSREPSSDIIAQARDMQDPQNERSGVYMPRSTVEQMKKAGKLKDVTGTGVVLDDFDGRGGILVAENQGIAEIATKARDNGAPMQEIIGILTGSGTGKPVDGDTMVQQVDEQGNVTRETLTTADGAQEAAQTFERPGHTVRTVPADQALQDRDTRAEAEIAGKKSAPVDLNAGGSIDQARDKVQSEPSEKQKEAGNYQKAHVKLHGMDVAIENAKGSKRTGTDSDGETWSVDMPADYGYIKRTNGADGDQVDVYIGDDHDSQKVFIVDQNDLETGAFDEHKVVMGVNSIPEAINLYDGGFSDGRGMDRIGSIKPMSVEQFKTWLKGNTRKPANGQTSTENAAFSPAPSQDAPVEVDQQPVSPDKGSMETGTPVSVSDGVRDDTGGTAPPSPAEDDKPANVFKSAAEAQSGYDTYLKSGKSLAIDKVAKAIGTNVKTAAGLLQETVKNGGLIYTKTGKFRRIGQSNKPMGLIEALTKAGGIRDNGGELAAMDLDKHFGPGGRLVRTNGGMTLDGAREWAVENGYLRDTPNSDALSTSTIRELLDAIAEDARDNKQVKEDDVTAQQEVEADQRQEWYEDQYSEAERLLIEVHGEDFVIELNQFFADSQTKLADWSDKDIDRAAKLVSQGETVDNAIERAAIEAIENGPSTGVVEEYDIPFDIGERDETIPRDPFESSAEIEPGGEESQKPERPVTDDAGRKDSADTGQSSAEPAEEVTADKPEPKPGELFPEDSQADQAKRKAEQALKPKAEQNLVMDDGLFSDEKDQIDMVDAPAGPRVLVNLVGKDGKTDAERGGSYLDNDIERILNAEIDKQFAEPKGDGRIGINKKGFPVYEDENGVRSYVENGIRITESVSFVPGGGIGVGGNRSSEFEPTAKEAAASAVRNVSKGLTEAITALDELFKPGNRLGSGPSFDEETYSKAKPHFKAALVHFKEAGKDVARMASALVAHMRKMGISAESIRNMVPYMARFIEDVKAGKESIGGNPDKETAPQENRPALAEPGTADDFTRALVDRLIDPDGGFKTIVEARQFAKTFGVNVEAGTAFAKELEEKIELALVMAAREIIEGGRKQGRSAEIIYNRLVGLYNRQPKLNVRTAESMADQAYSTPVPLSFLAQNLAGIGSKTLVYEPTAGNGSLVTAASPGNVIANEINPVRASNLSVQGFKVTQNRLPGQQPQAVRQQGAADVVIMNPPFGAVKDNDGNSIEFTSGDLKTTAIDHAIALDALEAMPDGGRAVLIVGGINNKTTDPEQRQLAYNTKQKRDFYRRLYSRYNVVDHFTADGSLYERQGAGWPVDVIVIHGRGKSDRRLPAAELPEQFFDWESLKGKLDAGQTEVSGQGDISDGDAVAPERPVGPRSEADSANADGGRVSPSDTADRQPDKLRGERDSGKRSGVREFEPGQSLRDKLESKQRGERDGTGEQTDSLNEGQKPYVPASNRKTLDTLIPANMRPAALSALLKIEQQHGSVDSFVAKNLQYSEEDLGIAFGADQVDAIALAISNAERGKAFIIGDQTGIGKGRVVAGMLRYAHINGMTPVFVTEKPNLYGDMIRDLNDIGMPKLLGRQVNATMTNTNEAVPLDNDALDWYNESEDVKDRNQQRKDGTLGGDMEPKPKSRGKFLKSGTTKTVEKTMRDIQANGRGDIDIVFTTYDQMNSVKGQDTSRRRFLRGIIPNSFIVLDESHNAFGGTPGGWQTKNKDGSEKAVDRATFARELTTDAKGVMFSSATYAKRPDGMDLYARTDLGDAVEDPKMLGEIISKGGVPMQQIVASMLADAGQYVRRERSYAGINYDMTTAEVDQEAYGEFISSLQGIVLAEENLKESEEYKDWVKTKTLEVGGGQAMDGATGDVGVSSTNFSSLMHNIVSQMLLSLKAEVAADAAIEQIKQGKKPVLTVANTMGAFIQRYATENSMQHGDVMNMVFGDVVSKYLDRTTRITVKIDEQKFHHDMPRSQMPENVKELYRQADAAISRIPEIPLSPIDAMKHRIQKAGYKIGEITGRTDAIDYSGGKPVYTKRPTREIKPAGRRAMVNQFNNGELDALLLNRAGSTGLSLHASSGFTDQKPRTMIIVQAEANINTHVQMLGRINRTGQVVLPSYIQLVANIPAETRPAAVLSRKMASLAANTTASRKSALSSEGVDFLNKYGDQVMHQVLQDHFDWSAELRLSETDYENDLARKATGKMILLKPKEQQQLIDEVQEKYVELIDQLDKLGKNELEAKFVDLKAETLDSETLKDGTGDSPFTQAVKIESIEMDAPGLAMKPAELGELLAETFNIDGASPVDILRTSNQQSRNKMMELNREWGEKHAPYIEKEVAGVKSENIKQNIRNEQRQIWTDWTDIIAIAKPGAIIQVKLDETREMPGVVTGLIRKGNAKNPVALSAWRLQVAVADNSRDLIIPFSSLSLNGVQDGKIAIESPDWTMKPENVIDQFAAASTTGRQKRSMVTGNIVAGYEITNGGQILNFSNQDGDVRQGILMPISFNQDKFMEGRPVRFTSGAQVLQFLDKVGEAEIASTDKVVTVSKDDIRGEYEIEMPKARASGGKYFLQNTVREAANDQWASVGNRMRWHGPKQQAERIMDAMRGHGAVFETRTNQEEADAIVKGPATMPSLPREYGPPANPNQNVMLSKVEYDRVKSAIYDIAKRILGRSLREVQILHSLDTGNAGEYMPYKGIIRIAIGTNDDPQWIMRHESIHALRKAGVLTKSEWAVLARHAPNWRQRYDVDGRYHGYYTPWGKAYEEMALTEEAVADAFADYFKFRDADTDPVVQKIFARLARFIEQVSNWLHGNGYTSAKQIFEDIETGKIGERQPSVPVTGPPSLSPAYATGRIEPTLPSRQQNAAPSNTPTQAALPRNVVSLQQSARRMTMQNSSSILEFMHVVRRKTQDRFIDIKRLQKYLADVSGQVVTEFQDVYLAESLFYGKTGKRLDDLRNDVFEPLMAKMSEFGISTEQLDEYLYARHATERNAEMARRNQGKITDGSGMSDQEADLIIDGFRQSGQLNNLETLAAEIDQLIETSRRNMLRDGLISQEMYDQWRSPYQYYVPLRGWEVTPNEDGDPYRPNIGRRFDIRGKEAKAATGRQSRADSPLAYVMMQAQQAIIRGEKNKVGKAFLRLVQGNPDPNMWVIHPRKKLRTLNKTTGLVQEKWVKEDYAPDILSVKIGGVPTYIKIKDPDIANAMKGLGADNMGVIGKTLHKLNRFLSAASTAYNPEFVITNLARDMQTAAINLAENDIALMKTKVIRDIPKAMKGVWKGMNGDRSTDWARYYHEFADAGGKIGFFGLDTIEDQKKNMERELKKLKPGMSQAAWNKVMDGAGLVQRVNMSVENALRLSTYVNARRAGVTKAKAASLARELTVNFNRRGEWGTMMNALYLFYNAGIQGTVRMFQALNNKKVRRIVYGVIGASFMLDMFNRMMAGDDDEGKNHYDNIDFWIKERNLIFMWPGGEGHYTKIPLPWGYNTFSVLGQQTSAAIFGKETAGSAAFNIGKTALNAFNPIGGSDRLTRMLSPTILDPFVDLDANLDFVDRKIKPDDFPGSVPRPESQKYWNSIDPSLKWISENLNSLTGGNEVRPGAIDISPETLEYWGNFIAGGAGAFVQRTFTFGNKLWSGEEVEAYQVPFVRRFYGSPSRYSKMQDYYDIRDEVRLTEKEFQLFREKRDLGKMKEIRARPEFKMVNKIKETDKTLRQLRKTIRRLREAGNLSDETKQRRIKAREDKMLKVMSNAKATMKRLEGTE